MSTCSLNDTTWNKSLWFALTVFRLANETRGIPGRRTDLGLSCAGKRRQVKRHGQNDEPDSGNYHHTFLSVDHISFSSWQHELPAHKSQPSGRNVSHTTP